MTKRYALRWYLTGALAARTGDEMAGPALLLAAFALTGSSARASAVLAAATVSAAVGGPVLGALLDRAPRPGRLLAGALCAHALGLTAVLLALDRLPLPVTLLLAVLTGMPGPALSGGWTSRLPTGPARATALDAMTFHTATLTGPTLTALTAHTLGAPTALAAAATLICAAAAVAPRLFDGAGPGGDSGATQAGRLRAAPAAGPGNGSDTPPPAPRLTARLAEGTRCLLTGSRLAAATLGTTLSCTAQGMVTACLPLLGERAFGSADGGALLLSGTAASALVANAVLARRAPGAEPGPVLRAGALLQAGAAALAATGTPAAILSAALLAGTGEGPQLTALFAVRHREAPPRLRAQIFTTGASVKVTGFALGAAAAGALTVRSLAAPLLTASALHLLAARVTAARRR